MASRKGGFSGGLNPFGSGSLGGLGQYDIGANLADLEVYKTEVAWGNGLATNAEYVAALTKAVNATNAGTHQREAAQNKLDDAVYRIDRSNAETAGLDQLIAFDTSAMAKMKPDNLRYQQVKNSLDSEMAQRRSRDYGKLVTDYNAGKTSTESLLAWVKTTVGTLAADAPDLQSWTSVQTDLSDRLVTEKDSKVYQDYQQGRMKPPEFVAYLTSRRDSYQPASPQYADWSRKLEDANKQIKDADQAKKDSAFFNRYDEGKVSDITYQAYLRTRIAGMQPDDPQKAEWQHRLTQATFSLAEDKLRFAVQMSKTVGAANTNTARLVSFYQAYRRTLNPGSAEWRTITRNLDALHAGGGVTSGSGGSGGGSGGSSGGRKGAKSSKYGTPGNALLGGPPLVAAGKAISPKYTLTNILGLFVINPTGKKKDVAAAKKYLDLNTQSLHNAMQTQDAVWLFHDPRRPGATVAELDPQGNPTGRRVPGSAYLPVTSEAMANLLTVTSGNFMALAHAALVKGDSGQYAYNLKRAGELLDNARTVDAQYRAQNWESWYKATSTAVDNATKAGDYGTAVRLSLDLAARLAAEQQNPYLDDTRRTRLDELGTKLANNPLMPTVNPDGSMMEGAVNLSALSNGEVVLNPGWHHVLSQDSAGRPTWGPVYDSKQDGSWDATHVTVHTTLGNQIVTGEVTKTNAAVNPLVYIKTADGWITIPSPQGATEIHYADEHGRLVRAYSLDGQTWISPAPGMPAPTIELNAQLTQVQNPDGSLIYVDATTGETVFTQSGGGWKPEAAYFSANPTAVSWYGQSAWEQQKIVEPAYDRMPGSEYRRLDPNNMDVGGVGQHMTLADTSPSGVVNFVDPSFRVVSDYQESASQARINARFPAPSSGDMSEAASQARNAGFGPSFTLPADTPVRYAPNAAYATLPGSEYRLAPGQTPNISPPSLLPGLTHPAGSGALGSETRTMVAPVTPPALKPSGALGSEARAMVAPAKPVLPPLPKIAAQKAPTSAAAVAAAKASAALTAKQKAAAAATANARAKAAVAAAIAKAKPKPPPAVPKDTLYRPPPGGV